MEYNVLMIEEFREAFLKRKGKFIEIITELNKKVVLEIPKIVEEESIFAETYKYPISETFKKLKKLKFTKKRVKRKVSPSKTKKINSLKVTIIPLYSQEFLVHNIYFLTYYNPFL